ncbi:MAG: type II toxin-antitoxin system RelE/ParE family toxin [Nitrospirae bacterium]|nr:type II toxin-antitoxin system RelE/ParE family toxin [Nitrospirota bacterium]MBI3351025.1 type II toxin-antitoxin system RelE/ParE family toxin [Nitrospirota bacterium]
MAQTIIRWSPRAVSNLEDICIYIAKDSRFFASFFAQKVFSIIKSLPKFSKSGRMVPEYGDETIREKIYKNYRIVYRINGPIIEIVAICHGTKPLKDLI